jgi:2,4-dienoyl-CoA reductase-like NADH-dependent reductase (Old Yellow Enzyme family)
MSSQPSSAIDLHTPLEMGGLSLAHRVVMAPLTRMRATVPGNTANALMAQHYGQRASQGGLIIAEASQVSQDGVGAPNTPGIHTEAQIAGWKEVTEAVHAAQGRVLLQLSHAGRQTVSQFAGEQPLAPSPIPCPVMRDPPREMTADDIERTLEYRETCARFEAGYRATYRWLYPADDTR